MTYSDEYNAQRLAIVTAVSSVDDVGRVHDRPRLGDFRERWVAELSGAPEIRSWELSAAPAQVVRREQGRRHRYRMWQLVGVIGLEDMSIEDSDNPTGDLDVDASYHELNRLAGEIADTLDAAREVWVAAGTFIDTDPVQFDEPDVVQIGGGPIAWGVTLTMRGYTIVTP